MGNSEGDLPLTNYALGGDGARMSVLIHHDDADREDGTEGGAATEEAGWELWDVTRALEGDCELKLHKFDDAEGNEVFWHSSAHILGQALETLYGCKLTHGPPLEPGAPSGGFFYDSYMGDVPFNTAMAVEVEKAVKKVCDAKQPFERVVVSKADGAPRRPCRCARAQPRQRVRYALPRSPI